MGRASSSKKVTRAARTGGGRTRRGTTSWGWPLAMALVVVLGSAGIVYSRDQRHVDTTAPRPQTQGGGDHWHTAIGFQVCGTFLPPVPDPKSDLLGIHTHGDGIVHTHPFTERASGHRARLKLFFDNVKAKVSATKVDLPAEPAKNNGDKCGDKPGVVRTKVWESRDPADKGRLVSGDPGEILLHNNQLITIAFGPKDAEIAKPPSESQLDSLGDVGPTTTLPVPGATPAPTTAAGATPTTAAGSTPTTAAGATPTTAATGATPTTVPVPPPTAAPTSAP